MSFANLAIAVFILHTTELSRLGDRVDPAAMVRQLKLVEDEPEVVSRYAAEFAKVAALKEAPAAPARIHAHACVRIVSPGRLQLRRSPLRRLVRAGRAHAQGR